MVGDGADSVKVSDSVCSRCLKYVAGMKGSDKERNLLQVTGKTLKLGLVHRFSSQISVLLFLP